MGVCCRHPPKRLQPTTVASGVASPHNSPVLLGAPKRAKSAGEVRNRLCGEEEAATSAILHGDEVKRYGISATCDAAAFHHQPIMVAAALFPVRSKPVLVDYLNISKPISNEGGKGSAAEARCFITAIKKTSEGGKCCFFLNTDTPTAQKAMAAIVKAGSSQHS